MSDQTRALAYDQGKAKLNLFDARLWTRAPIQSSHHDLGLQDFDKAYGKVIGWAEAKKLVRL